MVYADRVKQNDRYILIYFLPLSLYLLSNNKTKDYFYRTE